MAGPGSPGKELGENSGEASSPGLVWSGLLSLELLAVCGEPSGHREGPVVAKVCAGLRASQVLSKPFNLGAQEETEASMIVAAVCSCSAASTMYSSLATVGWVDLSWLGEFWVHVKACYLGNSGN